LARSLIYQVEIKGGQAAEPKFKEEIMKKEQLVVVKKADLDYRLAAIRPCCSIGPFQGPY